MKKTKSENIEITDYTEEILAQLGTAKEKALEELGLTMEAFAKSYETAIDTGRLRNSITYATVQKAGQEFKYQDDQGNVYTYKIGDAGDEERDNVYVGTNVEYAPYIEYGTSKIAGIHFLEKAVKNHKSEYEIIIKKYLDQPK